MVTFTLQVLVVLLSLGIGVGALRVHRRSPHVVGERRTAWLLAGAVFFLAGINGAVQNLFGAWALAEGPQSVAGAAWTRMHPVGNYGRSFAFVGFAIMLLFPALGRRAAAGGSWARASLPLLFCMAVGSVAGFLEGPFQLGHYLSVSVVDAAAVLLLLAALLRAAIHDGMDYLLWVGLAAYTLREAVAILMISILAWMDKAWFPPVVAAHGITAVAYAVLLGCTLWRLVLARRGAPVPALFELGGGGSPPAPHGGGWDWGEGP